MDASKQFSALEEGIIEQLDEPFRSKFLLAAYRLREKLSSDKTVKMYVRDAWRDSAIQEKHYRVGRHFDPVKFKWVDLKDPMNPTITDALPGESAHNYRRACHLVLTNAETREWLPPNQKVKKLDERWLLVGEAVKTVDGLIWGGDWRRRDYAHVELAGWKDLAKKRGWLGLGPTERAPG